MIFHPHPALSKRNLRFSKYKGGIYGERRKKIKLIQDHIHDHKIEIIIVVGIIPR